MERIMYRKTLDVHKNGIQFMLQGFETADNMSRVIEISLMASGDAIDFPLENVEAIMFVKTPSASEPSINKCTIKDNKVVYEVLPIVEEGITNMQLKIIETSIDGATGILASPKFAVEVSKSDTDDESAERTTTFTALEDALAKAKAVYDERFLRMELSSDCMFRAYYADGTIYETDILKELFLNGNVLLSESYAHGGTGVRAGEDTDNSMYYSNVSRSEALNAKNVMINSEELLEEVKLHGVYTAFSVNFETGEAEYVSPSYKFKVNFDTGELDAEGKTFAYETEIGRIVAEWLEKNDVSISDLITTVEKHETAISKLSTSVFEVKITTEGKSSPSSPVTIETTYEEILGAVESGKRVFARFYKTDGTRYYDYEFPLIRTNSNGCLFVGGIDYHSNTSALDYSEDILERLYYITLGADSSVTLEIKPLGGACVVHGHYIGYGETVDNGDGTYTYYGVGKDAPNSLSFDFKPKLLYIWHGNTYLLLTKHDTEEAPDESNYDAYLSTFDYFNGAVDVSQNILISKTFDGHYVEWYAYTINDDVEVKPRHQMNDAGKFYEYIAIG